MKNLLAILLISLSAIGYTQDPLVFINQDATWNVARTYPNANPDNPSFAATTTTVFGFSGDTLIDNELWDKYYFTSDSNFVEGLTYVGCMQEADGIVLFMDTTNAVGTLYNFNLTVGDSVFYDFGFDSAYLKVNWTMTIAGNGVSYRVLVFEKLFFPPFFVQEVWMEGIGSIHGPLFPAYPDVFTNELPDSLFLTCYKIENQVIWIRPFYSECYINIVLSVVELRNPPDFKIYPNPAHSEIYITSDSKYLISEIYIYNQLGQTVMHQIRYDGTLDVSSLLPGIYFVELVVGNQRIREKLVINRTF
jgi:hypothetical protein